MSRSALLKNTNFKYLWTGDAFGQFGAQLAGFVLPIFAVQYLNATELEMGILNAAEQAAFLIIGLPVGAWVDRMRKRRVLIIADIVRATVLALLVTLTALGYASIPLLIGVALAMSVCNTFFDVAYQSFIPTVTGKELLLEGNSKLEATHSIMFIAGPALGGLLIKAISPITVLGGTIATYLVSGFTLSRINIEEDLKPKTDRTPLAQEIKEGLSWVFKHKILRRIVATTALSNLFNAMAQAVMLIFLLRQLDMPTQWYGVVIAVAGIGGLVGAVFAERLGVHVGIMRIIPMSALVWGLSEFLIPLAVHTTLPFAVAMVTTSMFISNFCVLVYNIAQVTYRQRECPPELLGRMNASVRFVVWGVGPIGALLGGIIGANIGALPTIWIATALGLLTAIPVLPALWGGFSQQNEIEQEAREHYLQSRSESE